MSAKKVKVRVIRKLGYWDLELEKQMQYGDEFIVDKPRADYLEEINFVEII